MKPLQNVHSAVPVVTAPQLSVRLTLVKRAVRVEDAVWNATEPHVNSVVPEATVRCSVRVRLRPASKHVQQTKTGLL